MKDVMANIDIDLRCVAAQEHVAEVERSIRVIKERFRSVYHRLPFQGLPKLMIRLGVMETARWLNTFPAKNGISDTYSPRMIVTGKGIDYIKQCKTAFGAYVQALNETNPTNTMAPRTIGCIYLCYIEGHETGYELLNLTSGKLITRQKFTKIPTSQDVIERVEALARRDGIKPDLVFRDRKGRQLRDDADPIAGVDSEDNGIVKNETVDPAPTQQASHGDNDDAESNDKQGELGDPDNEQDENDRINALRETAPR